MPETSLSSPPYAGRPARRRRGLWWKLPLVFAGLLVLAYFGLSSQAFLKAVVLPRVGAAMNARVTVEGISLSPLSRLHVKGLRLETTGVEPLLRAEEATVRYRLFSLVGGKIALPEITLVKPVLKVVEGPDGRSNLDPLLGEPEPEPTRRGAITLDLGPVTVRSGVLSYETLDRAGVRQLVTLSNLDVTLSGAGNGRSGKLTLGADALQARTSGGGGTDTARGKLASTLDFRLAADLFPRELRGDLGVRFTDAQGALEELAGWAGTLQVDLTPDELRQLALKFERQGQSLGEARFRGPLSLDRKLGRVDFTLTSLGHTGLNLLGAPFGLSFGQTALEGSGFCDVSKAGQLFTVSIKLAARNFSVRQGSLATPPLDLQLELRGNADLEIESASLDRLSLIGRQAGTNVISVDLARAIPVSWRAGQPPPTAPGVGQVTINDLPLADWSSLIGTNLQAGRLNLSATVHAADAGQRVTLDFTNTVQGLSLQMGETFVRDAQAMLAGTLSFSEFAILQFERGTFSYGEGADTLVDGTLSATHDSRTGGASVQLAATTDLARFLARHPLPNLAFSRGGLRASLLLNWGKEQVSANTALSVGDVNGKVGGFEVSGYSAQFEAVGELQRDKFSLRRLGLSAREGTRAGGSAEATGEFDGANQTAQLSLNIAGLNQAALRPVLAAVLTSYGLASISVEAAGQLRYDARQQAPETLDYLPRLQLLMDRLAAGVGETALQLRASTTNLVLTRVATGKPSPATGFMLGLDVSRRGDVFQLGQSNRFQLPATSRASNALSLTGRLDLAATNPTPSTLSLRSTGLDLTPLYAWTQTLFAPDDTATTPAPAPAVAATEAEPEPIALPVRKLDADLQVDALYLDEIAIKNWVGKAVVDDGKVTVSPFSLSFNDTPVTARAFLDLTRPGYVYDLRLDAPGLPLEPIVNSTAPDYRGKVRGNLLSQVQIAGAGITGPSLQRSLNGAIRLSCTNLNFEIVTPRTKRLLTTLATAFRIQDLARSPLTLLMTDLAITNGSINVQPFMAASDAFFATAEGAIRLAPVISNSTVNLPVQFALREDLARQIKLVNLTPSTRSNYLALPPLVRLAGTVGVPETDIDKVRLAALLAGSLGGAIGGQTGTALEGVNSLLQGNTQGALGSLNTLLQRPSPSAATNAPVPGVRSAPLTNAPGQAPPQTPASQNSTAVEGVNRLLPGNTGGALSNLNRLLQRPAPASTNPRPVTPAPATTTNAPAK